VAWRLRAITPRQTDPLLLEYNNTLCSLCLEDASSCLTGAPVVVQHALVDFTSPLALGGASATIIG